MYQASISVISMLQMGRLRQENEISPPSYPASNGRAGIHTKAVWLQSWAPHWHIRQYFREGAQNVVCFLKVLEDIPAHLGLGTTVLAHFC